MNKQSSSLSSAFSDSTPPLSEIRGGDRQNFKALSSPEMAL